MKANPELTKSFLLNKNSFQCYHNNKGYCCYGQKCRFQHYKETCSKSICKDKECPKRHPKHCKWGERCKFLRKNICAFKHEPDANHLVPNNSTYEDEMDKLRIEIVDLKRSNQMKQKKLCELFEETDERETIIDDLKAQAEELKNCILNYKKENSDLKTRITNIQSKCVFCDFTFVGDSDLKSRISEKYELKGNKKICNEYKNPETFATDDAANHESYTEDVMYFCDKCDFEYEEEDAVETHKELYHENNCDDCGEHFEQEDALKTHYELHHVNECDQCEYTSTTHKGLKIHQGVKHKEKQIKSKGSRVNETYSCDKCCLKFTTKQTLKAHQDGMHKAILTF